MGAGKYEQVGSSDGMKFMDPTGKYNSALDQFGNDSANAQSMMNSILGNLSYDPQAFMNAFMGQSDALANQVSGQNSQLQQSLNNIASRQAALGGEAALANMPGMRNSGAAMAAFGQAYADPFAQAQAQLQQNQLQGTLGLWNQAMGQYADQYAQQAQLGLGKAGLYGQQASDARNAYGNMLQNASAWYTPQYEYQKGGWDYAMDAINTGANVGQAIAGFIK